MNKTKHEQTVETENRMSGGRGRHSNFVSS